MDLGHIGWSESFEKSFHLYIAERCKKKDYYKSKSFSVGRVFAQYKSRYIVYTERGEEDVVLRRVFMHDVESRADLPVVGDWVVLINADKSTARMIDGILPRKTQLSRNSERSDALFHDIDEKNTTKKKYSKLGKGEQVVGANIDIAFIVSSLNQEFNIRRLERYLSMVLDGGVEPVIILSKTDLCDEHDVTEKRAQLSKIAQGVPVYSISAIDGSGLESLEHYWRTNKTMVLIGSSGVGKSTLINTLLGFEKMNVAEITSYKDKGQHTTTHKELIILEQGGLIIDTPGIRDIQLTVDEDTLQNVFSDVIDEIEALSGACKYRNCSHKTEQGCAVLEALKRGVLSQDRWDAYNKLLQQVQKTPLKKAPAVRKPSKKELRYTIKKELKDSH